MKITIITLFPQMFPANLGSGLIGKANFELNIVDLKKYSTTGYLDQRPFGGGEGMLICPSIIENVMSHMEDGVKIFPSPEGVVFNQKIAENLAKEDHLIFLCGRYEGVDCRPLKHYDFQSISLGDFILCGGEVAAMTMIETIVRLQKGTLSNEDSVNRESFYDGLLVYDQFCEFRTWKDRDVPDLLLQGNHKLIEEWRYENSLIKTLKYRPDLFYYHLVMCIISTMIVFVRLRNDQINTIKNKLFFQKLRKFRNN